MLIGWNGETLPALELEEEIATVARAGYAGIELFIPKLRDYLQVHTAIDLHRLLTGAGLGPLSMNGIENINLRSPLEFAEVQEECRWLAEVSQIVGCPTIVAVPSLLPGDIGWPRVRDNTVAALSVLADIARPYGVKVAFEFLAPANCSVRTLSQAWDIVEATRRDSVGIVFDTYHFCVGGSSWESLEEFDVDRLYIVHINDVEDLPFEQLTDGHRLLPGEGVLPLETILRHLHERGYSGACSLEVMRPAYRQREPSEYAAAGLAATQRLLRQAGAI